MYTNSTYIFLRTILCYVLLRGSKSKLHINSTFKKLLLFHTRFTFTMIRIYVIHVIITHRSLSPETTYFVISLQVWLAAVNRFVPESYKRKPTVSLSAFLQNTAVWFLNWYWPWMELKKLSLGLSQSMTEKHLINCARSYPKNITRGCFATKEGYFCLGKLLAMFIFKAN